MNFGCLESSQLTFSSVLKLVATLMGSVEDMQYAAVLSL